MARVKSKSAWLPTDDQRLLVILLLTVVYPLVAASLYVPFFLLWLPSLLAPLWGYWYWLVAAGLWLLLVGVVLPLLGAVEDGKPSGKVGSYKRESGVSVKDENELVPLKKNGKKVDNSGGNIDSQGGVGVLSYKTIFNSQNSLEKVSLGDRSSHGGSISNVQQLNGEQDLDELEVLDVENHGINGIQEIDSVSDSVKMQQIDCVSCVVQDSYQVQQLDMTNKVQELDCAKPSCEMQTLDMVNGVQEVDSVQDSDKVQQLGMVNGVQDCDQRQQLAMVDGAQELDGIHDLDNMQELEEVHEPVIRPVKCVPPKLDTAKAAQMTCSVPSSLSPRASNMVFIYVNPDMDEFD